MQQALPRSEFVENDGLVFIYNDEEFPTRPHATSVSHIAAAVVLQRLTKLTPGQIREMLNLGYIGPMRIELLQEIGNLLKARGISVWYTSSGYRLPEHRLPEGQILPRDDWNERLAQLRS